DQNPGVRVRRDLARGGDAVDVRHAHVHQHHVGLRQPALLDRLTAVRGFADDDDRVVGGQDGSQAGTHEVVVVDDQNAYRHEPAWVPAVSPRGSRTSNRNVPSSVHASKLPPSSEARSRMPTIPCPPTVPAATSFIGLVTAMSMDSCVYRTAT